MAKGGKRPGAGRKKLPRAEHKTSIQHFLWLIEELNKQKSKAELAKECGELKGWRELWEAKDIRVQLDTRKFIYDHAYGKATQPVDHGVTGVVKVELLTNVNMPDPHE
jgi:hypothetical protein